MKLVYRGTNVPQGTKHDEQQCSLKKKRKIKFSCWSVSKEECSCRYISGLNDTSKNSRIHIFQWNSLILSFLRENFYGRFVYSQSFCTRYHIEVVENYHLQRCHCIRNITQLKCHKSSIENTMSSAFKILQLNNPVSTTYATNCSLRNIENLIN